MRLLVDHGNTRVKWRFDRADGTRVAGAIEQAAVGNGDGLMTDWLALPRVDEVVIASVGDRDVRDSIVDAARRAFGHAVIREVRTAARFGPVRIAYAEPSRLGVDRFLAMLAAHDRAPRDQLVIGIGTALTVDALAADGRHVGGLIAPGPVLMQRSLVDATAGIRPDAEGRIVDFASDTADAITSGAWHAVAGLVERSLARSSAWAPAEPVLVCHGGDAATLMRLIERACELVPDLVLDGLAAWTDRVAIDGARTA